MTVPLAPVVQFFDNNGDPLSGGKVFTYQAGTTSPQPTFTDREGATVNANPVVLDAAGRAQIWLALNAPYKIIVQSAGGTTVATADNVYGGADPAQLQAAGIVPATGGVYNGLVQFKGGALFGGNLDEALLTIDSLGLGAVQSSNLWINSDFAINQRLATTGGDSAYGFDRAVTLCEAGVVNLAQMLQPADGIPFALSMTQPDGTSKRIGCLQIVEARNCLAFRSKKLVFAPKVRCSVNATVRVALVSWNGAQDFPTRDVINSWTSTNYSAGAFFIANTQTIAVGAAAVAAGAWTDVIASTASAGGIVAPPGMQNLYMVVWTETPLPQGAVLALSVMRAGQGTSIPLWTPPNAAVELLRCRRYLRSTLGASTFGVGQVTGNATIVFSAVFGETMFRTPNLMANQIAALNATGTPIAVNTATLGTATPDAASINLSMSAASFVAGNAATVLSFQPTAGLVFDAEIGN